MKLLPFAPLVLGACLLHACGARDDKNEVHNYPTYDTTRQVDNKNDTKNPEAINAEGDLRHNLDSEEKEK
jgi:hypothetical protein